MAGAAEADYAVGLEVYDGGNYAGAFAAWLPLAKAGDVLAQNTVAGMYRDGVGLERDLAEAARWYGRAARAGSAVGQMNLGEMYARGQGVGRDAITAHMWLGLAAAQGRTWADRHHDAMARAMTSDEIAEVERRIRAFRPETR